MRKVFSLLFIFIFWVLPEIIWAAPTPTVAITSSANPKRAEDIVLTLTLDNTGNQIGYFPYFRFILPSQLSNPVNADSCGGIGSPLITTSSTNPSIDPYVGESITLAAGQKVVYVVPPVAQLTPGQPAISCQIRVNATAAANFSVTNVRSLFAYGALENGEARPCGGAGNTLCSGTTSHAITTRYAYVTTTAIPPTAAGTGPKYPISVNTTVDIAAGQTLTTVVLTDVLPDSLVISDPGNCSQITVNPSPTTCSFTPDGTSASGGTVRVTYTTVSSDISLTYSGYIRSVNDAGGSIVNPATGAKTTSQNNVTLTSTQTGAITPTTPVTFQQRSIHVTKSVAVASEAAGGKAGFSPGDTIEWTYQMAISDYFAFENISIADTLQDGQTYVNGSLSLTVSENTTDTAATENNLEAQGHLIITPAGAGTTTIALNLGAAMTDAFFGFADGILQGANSFGAANRATKVTLVYRTTINENFAGAGGSVDSGDQIRDTVTGVITNIVGQGGNYNFGADLPLTTTAAIVPITSYAKTLTHINGAGVGAAPHSIAAGNLVVFKLRIVIPDGGGENLTVADYLPGPIFNPPGGCLSYAAAAATALTDGQWTFGANTPGLVSGDVAVTCDAANDKIQFAIADIDMAAGTSDSVIEIYFAVTATTDPSKDNYEFANTSFLSYLDSTGATVATTLAAAGFISDTPEVTLNSFNITATDDTNGAIASGNLTGVDAGALNTFTATLTNNGTGTAQDGVLTVVWPAGYEAPSNPTSCTQGGGSDCAYNFSVGVGCGGATVVTASDNTQVLVSNIDINQGATCSISFDARLALSAQPAQLLTAEAEFNWTNGGIIFPPKFDTATTTMKSPTITVTSITAPAVPVPGDDIDTRITMVVPEGTSNGFFVDVVDSSFVTFAAASNATVNMTITTQVINAVTHYCMINAATFTNNICFTNNPTASTSLSLVGGNLRINFGKVINGYSSVAGESVIFDVLDGIIDAAATSGAKTIRADYYWANPNAGGNLSVLSSNGAVSVYTPKLTVTKCATATTTAAAPISLSETVSYNILVANTGSFLATAYDVANLSDSLTSGTTYVPGSVSAYYCTSGASTKSCANWTPAAAGCTAVVTAPAGNVVFPVVNNSANPDIAADGYYHITFTADVNCENVADSSGLDLAPNHPDNNGINDACADPVLVYAASLSNSISTAAYSSQDGAGPNGVEGSYTMAASNITSLSLDSDGDGIINSLETNADADGDGVPNYLDTDSDDNGIPDSVEANNLSSPLDSENDGVPNYKDLDDDGDGINDSQEITNTGGATADVDNDGLVDFRDPDADNDGVSDLADGQTTNSDGAADGTNANDKDSDNDGIPDVLENGLGTCDNGTGAGNPNDGALHADEVAACNVSVCTGGTCDDDGNKGIEADEFVGGVLPDLDGDGIPNFLDLDSDNDGLPDFYENLIGQLSLTGVNAIDANSNGFVEGATVPGPISGELLSIGNQIGNTNGVVDVTEALDSDADGVFNFLDTDSDNDGVPDIVENGRYIHDANGDNRIAYGAGLEYDSAVDTNLIGPGDQAVIDTDGDLVFNYLDSDSDGDGISDWIEAWGSNIDTGPVDGKISSAEFAAAITSYGNNNTYFTSNEYRDTDADGLPDIFDSDSDNDSIRDLHESDLSDNNAATVVSLFANMIDTDNDGNLDFRETDSDADGFLDSVEAGDALAATVPVDTDSDGVPDCRDTDSDNDGLLDVNEPTAGTGRTTADSDGDACRDGCEIYGNAYSGPGVCSYSGKSWSAVGTLLAPITDPLDADTDNGGTSDCVEASSAGNPNPRAGNGADDPYLSDDPDGDGLNNAQELIAGSNINTADTDGDTVNDGDEVLVHGTNPLAVDTDGGGVNDATEIAISGDPLNPNDDDSDGDSLGNIYESSIGLNQNQVDSNNDCLNDVDEIGGDLNAPLDTDRDGLIDALDLDNDGDGVLDCEETQLGTSPFHIDISLQGGGGGCGLILDHSRGKGSPSGIIFSYVLALLLILLFFMRLRFKIYSRRLAHVVFMFSIVFLTEKVSALDVQLFHPQIHNGGTYTLYGTSPLSPKEYHYGLTSGYVMNPLTFGKTSSSEHVDEVVNSLHTFNLLGVYQNSEKWGIFIDAPIHYVSDFEPAESTSSRSAIALGDVLLGAHYSIWDKQDQKFGLAVLPYASLPTGSEKSFVGEGVLKLGVKVAADKEMDSKNYIATNIGYVFRKRENIYQVDVGNTLTYGFGYVRTVSGDRLYEVLSEFYGQRPMGGASADDVNSPLEAMVGVRKYWANQGGRWDLGLSRGLNAGYGSPEARLFFSLTWGPVKKAFVARTEDDLSPPPPSEIAKKLEVPVKIKVETIYFEAKKSTIKSESYKSLNDLIATLNKYPEIAKMRIEGHTDDVGTLEKNMQISKERAEAVYDYLVQGGVDPNRLERAGLGPVQPIADNKTVEGREANRRVEFKIIEFTGDLNKIIPVTE